LRGARLLPRIGRQTSDKKTPFDAACVILPPRVRSQKSGSFACQPGSFVDSSGSFVDSVGSFVGFSAQTSRYMRHKQR
jgi:hypothetical protein